MSIICGALRWLFDAENRILSDIKNAIITAESEIKAESDGGSDWINAHHKNIKARDKKFELTQFLSRVVASNDLVKEVCTG